MAGSNQRFSQGVSQLDSQGFPLGFRLGLVGGGQLGRMVCQEARNMGIHTIVLDPSPRPPAYGIADECIQGSLTDSRAILELAARVDVLSYEIEHIDVNALYEAQAAGTRVHPRPGALEIIQDKLVQKQLFKDAGLAVPAFRALDDPETLADEQLAGELENFGLPCIQKTRAGGYDGRGVTRLEPASPADLKARALKGPSMIEEAVDFTMELAVLIARNPEGESRVYPVVEMVFDSRSQICNSVCVPARISEVQSRRAMELARAAVDALEAAGLFAVELFLTSDGEILINEVAPRPHNSGHWSIEAAETSQFQQFIRAVCGLPLGSPQLRSPAVMINLLGEASARGTPAISGFTELMSSPGAYMHWYGKEEVRPLRKMGHITVLNSDLEIALKQAEQLERTVSVRAV
ncbi:5-(carboxyamino)imidazole ribonucleotide synthase [Salinispira pacifica]|uniref:N5-carboxyaminoimidazole ribonucleotide synthase n=1 Tax=Salinispira pacifica TaxID=1307761 RepID=V5WL01_9SPIO|nr:5-(carboxyamino)imidazole ribonucleotide synthase [Salinispira pacifica]AHC16325.1 Phosphoribosylaminoimidazole carboxylase ATPase subunit [Salinispira pacifica]